MSAARRQRLIRAREIQHRIAAAVSVIAAQKQQHLETVSGRILSLRHGLSQEPGTIRAHQLAVTGELGARLELAQKSLIPHREAAGHAYATARSATIGAALAEKRMVRLDERRGAEEERQRELRAMAVTRRGRAR